jgi:hypothetical protein
VRIFSALVAVLLLALPADAGNFAGWAAIVVAGDWHAHSGAPSEVFDNGRRKISDELVLIGFRRENILQFSVRPQRDPAHSALPSKSRAISEGLDRVAKQAGLGCLVYFTSHGSDEGIVLGNGELTPKRLARMVDGACGHRPTVVVVSACFSGVFVPVLRGANRIVVTAASATRPSFGCGETDKYTFFDTCAVEWLPKAGNFPDFGHDVIDCVHKREKVEHVDVASHPQLSLGPHLASAFPRWK